MIADMMPGTEEQLQKELTSAYVGIDPTADSLHIGHLVSVMMLKHFQRAGHRPIALVGGATGMIGDPSMKSAERNLLDEATLRHNQDCIKKQLAKFLDFDSEAPNAAKLVNNYDWMKGYSFLNFIRDIGKHITVCIGQRLWLHMRAVRRYCFQLMALESSVHSTVMSRGMMKQDATILVL